MKIAVTGGIATGKSTVARLLGRYLGTDVLDADVICRDLLVKGQPGWREVRRIWGERFLNAGGHIDRVLLRKAVFSDKRLRKKLEEILHPMARIEIAKSASEKGLAGENILVEVPLLFEVGWRQDFDWVVTIYATEKRCLQRIVIRDNVTPQDAAKVLAAQMPLVCKVLLADSVIDNSGYLAHTCFQVGRLAGYLRNSY
jgi:dephospho-CoA kinase